MSAHDDAEMKNAPPAAAAAAASSSSSAAAASSAPSTSLAGDSKMEAVKGLDDGDDDATLKLKSAEGEIYQVPKKICMMSELVKTMAEGDKEADDIPLLNVKSNVLKKIVEYLRYHSDNPPKDIEKVGKDT
jgi:hypothetical protein